MASDINYAKFSGFNSLAAAIVFAILYFLLLGIFVFKSFRIPTYVHYVMVFFCTIRVTAFAIRAALTTSESAGENLGVLIADEILFGVGYFGLLFSAYTLVLNWEAVTRGDKKYFNPILRITQNRRIFRLTLTIAVVLGIVASSRVNSDGSSPASSIALRKASTIIFLILTALLAFQTIHLARVRAFADTVDEKERGHTFGRQHRIFILLVAALLLLVREAFYTATMSNDKRAKQFDERFWYPLVALPEVLVVMIFAIPGLVPSKQEVAAGEQETRELQATHHNQAHQ